MDKLRMVQLEKVKMLKKFADVCARNSLTWFAEGGTLLGAVRHGGFIPWDDDIDVCMPRKDYNRLCMVNQDEFLPYFLQWRESDWSAARMHVQIRNPCTTEILRFEMKKGRAKFRFNQGLFIDVFPLENCPETAGVDIGRKLDGLKFKAWDSRHDRAACISAQVEFEKTASMFDASCLVDTFAVNYRPARFTPIECYGDLKMVDFEDMAIPAPIGYETRLEKLYGKDWRTPRNEPSVHGGTFVDLFRPYTDYLQC